MFYELITRSRPFPHAHGPAGLITAQLNEQPKPPSQFASVPDDLDRVILACLQKERAARPADVAELAAMVAGLVARYPLDS
jgi:serine/threonine-protein kinase